MSEEQQYISLLHEITNFGSKRDDRTGTGVYSLFGKQLKLFKPFYGPKNDNPRVNNL